MAHRRGGVYIGTSGFSYKEWSKAFYPEDLPKKEHLSYYAEQFNAVEINATFYHLPKPESLESWQDTTGDSFKLCLKLSRYITHTKKLLDAPEHVDKFFERIGGLEAKHRGPLLLQLPPSLKPQYERLESALSAIAAHKDWRVAVEIRKPEWYGDDLNALLDRYQAALVLQDMPGSATDTPNQEAGFIYQRFHGPTGDYGGHYEEAFLKETAGRLAEQRRKGRDIYAFFNNDRDVGAPDNAKRLYELIMES